MDLTRILVIVLLSVLHLLLAGMLLDDVATRKKVLGGRKIPWIIIIFFIVFVGALVYLLCHPRVFYGNDND